MILSVLVIGAVKWVRADMEAAYNVAPECRNRDWVGEIRPLSEYSRCMDVSMYDGMGPVGIYECDGHKDQLYMWCSDLTIRNFQENYCLTVVGNGLSFEPCKFDREEVPSKTQRWWLAHSHYFHDDWGIKQHALCLNPLDLHPDGCYQYPPNSGFAKYSNSYSDYWVFRSRGKQVAWGRIVSQEAPTNVVTYQDWGSQGWGFGKSRTEPAAKGDIEQVCTMYENGEIVNQKTNWCLQRHQDGFQVFDWPCYDDKQQIWKTDFKKNGDWFPLISYFQNEGGDEKCVRARAEDYLWLGECTWRDNEYFKWDEDTDWEPAQGFFNKVGCTESESFKFTYTAGREYSETITSEISFAVGTTISAGIEGVGGIEISAEMSTSMGQDFTRTSNEETTVETTCGNYEDGVKFVHGCMWQFMVEVKYKWADDHVMKYKPVMTKCTRKDEEPKCAPLWMCADPECTKCKPMDEGYRAMDTEDELDIKGKLKAEGEKPRSPTFGEDKDAKELEDKGTMNIAAVVSLSVLGVLAVAAIVFLVVQRKNAAAREAVAAEVASGQKDEAEAIA